MTQQMAAISPSLQFHASRVPALDGVRGVAFLIVLFAHTAPQFFPGGNFGVDLFFVLSGFLITSLLIQEADGTGLIDVKRFYLRRALRLFPALAAMVTFVVIYAAIFEPNLFQVTLRDAGRIVLYIFNWSLSVDARVSQDSLTTLHQKAFTHLWSLSIEEQFYIVWPFVLLSLTRLRAPRVVFLLVVLVGIVEPAIARFLLWPGGPALWMYFRTDLRFDNLMWGALAAFLVHWRWMPRGDFALKVLSWLGLVAGVGVVVLSRYNLVTNGAIYQGGLTLIGFLASLAIGVAVWCPPPIMKRFLEFPPLRWVGKISYGLYLWHVPILQFFLGRVSDPWVRNGIAIPLIFVVAALSFYYWEQPFLRLKRRVGYKKTSALMAQ